MALEIYRVKNKAVKGVLSLKMDDVQNKRVNINMFKRFLKFRIKE